MPTFSRCRDCHRQIDRNSLRCRTCHNLCMSGYVRTSWTPDELGSPTCDHDRCWEDARARRLFEWRDLSCTKISYN